MKICGKEYPDIKKVIVKYGEDTEVADCSGCVFNVNDECVIPQSTNFIGCDSTHCGVNEDIIFVKIPVKEKLTLICGS